jgi:hypothetical protein
LIIETFFPEFLQNLSVEILSFRSLPEQFADMILIVFPKIGGEGIFLINYRDDLVMETLHIFLLP